MSILCKVVLPCLFYEKWDGCVSANEMQDACASLQQYYDITTMDLHIIIIEITKNAHVPLLNDINNIFPPEGSKKVLYFFVTDKRNISNFFSSFVVAVYPNLRAAINEAVHILHNQLENHLDYKRPKYSNDAPFPILITESLSDMEIYLQYLNELIYFIQERH